MLPGGIGSTEATIAALLALARVDVAVGVLAADRHQAVHARFAILCGLMSMIGLEWQAVRGRSDKRSADPRGAR